MCIFFKVVSTNTGGRGQLLFFCFKGRPHRRWQRWRRRQREKGGGQGFTIFFGTKVLVLLSASVERFIVSRMRDFSNYHYQTFCCLICLTLQSQYNFLGVIIMKSSFLYSSVLYSTKPSKVYFSGEYITLRRGIYYTVLEQTFLYYTSLHCTFEHSFKVH